MSTARSFNEMLNEYLHYDLLMHETKKRNFLLNRIEMDTTWKGGTLVVPFQGGSASSFKYGGLTATNDVSENKYVRGEVTTQKEIWGTMMFHSRDLQEHDGKVKEASFLSNLPGTIERFVDDMKQVVSVNLLCGTHFASLTADGEADGDIIVDHPERFTINQKVVVKDANSSVTGYVRTIDTNTKTVKLYDARTGGAVVDCSGIDLADSPKCYFDGAETTSNAFTSVRGQLLSAANGGEATLFGQTKTTYPFLQATNYDGTAIDADNILDKLFDALTEHRKLGKGQATEFVLSYKHLGSIMKRLNTLSGPYRHVTTEANVFGWTTITIVGVSGEMKITGVQEMDDDIIWGADWKSLKLHTNQGFKKHKDPEGKMYYTERATDGFRYFVDLAMYGELVVSKPAGNLIIHTVAY
jgi:hypothetical protein